MASGRRRPRASPKESRAPAQDHAGHGYDAARGHLVDSSSGAKPSRPSCRGHAAVILVTLVLAAWAYWPALDGEFVYDDLQQIVDNALIQHHDSFLRALTSDVWAFQGLQADRPRNYWRPTFVAVLAAEFRVFGLDPRGWHVVNVGVHAVVALLTYVVLLQLGLTPLPAAVASWVFVVHPVHAQSVAWISGLPDPLSSVFLLGAYACYLEFRKTGLWRWLTAALLLFALALGAKETSVALVGVIGVTEWVCVRGIDMKSRISRCARAAAPFVVAVAAFAVARLQVLGTWRSLSPEAPGWPTVLATVPRLLLFYLRQLVWPSHLGPVQPIRYPDASTTQPWVLPLDLAVILSLGVVFWRLQRGRPLAAIGISWMLFPLLPVLDTRVFQQELMAQDRYLYLPVLGLLLVFASVVPAPMSSSRSRVLVVVALAASCATALAQRREAAYWRNGLALWEHAVEIDPTSSIAWSQLGDEYQSRGRLREGRAAFDHALVLRPDFTAAQVGLAIVAGKEQRWGDVERLLRPVLARLPDHETAIEQLGQAYQQRGQFEQAIALFEQAQRRVPRKRDWYSVNVAVLTAQAGRLAEATRQLERLVSSIDDRSDAGMMKAWWYLAELHRVQEDRDRARTAYERYLAISSHSQDLHVQKLRGLARQSLALLGER